jgi:hypothetical protein
MPPVSFNLIIHVTSGTSKPILIGRLAAEVDHKWPAGRISQSRRKAVVMW